MFSACDIPRFDEAKRIQYEKDMFDERKHNGELAAARKEGEKLKAIEIAKNMLSMSIDVVTIAQATGLSVEDIENL